MRNFRSSFCFPKFSDNNNIRYDRSLDGGALNDAGAYVLKSVSAILGGKLKVLTSTIIDNHNYNVDWYGAISGFDIINKIPCQLTFGFDNYYQCNYEILGSTGKITVLRAFTAKLDFEPKIILEKKGNAETIVLPSDDHFKNMLIYFADLVENKNFDFQYNEILNQASLIEKVRNLAYKTNA